VFRGKGSAPNYGQGKRGSSRRQTSSHEHSRGPAFTWQDPPASGQGYPISISSKVDLNGKLGAAEQVRPTHRCAERSTAAYR
jgi:hypothetical protein